MASEMNTGFVVIHDSEAAELSTARPKVLRRIPGNHSLHRTMNRRNMAGQPAATATHPKPIAMNSGRYPFFTPPRGASTAFGERSSASDRHPHRTSSKRRNSKSKTTIKLYRPITKSSAKLQKPLKPVKAQKADTSSSRLSDLFSPLKRQIRATTLGGSQPSISAPCNTEHVNEGLNGKSRELHRFDASIDPHPPIKSPANVGSPLPIEVIAPSPSERTEVPLINLELEAPDVEQQVPNALLDAWHLRRHPKGSPHLTVGHSWYISGRGPSKEKKFFPEEYDANRPQDSFKAQLVAVNPGLPVGEEPSPSPSKWTKQAPSYAQEAEEQAAATGRRTQENFERALAAHHKWLDDIEKQRRDRERNVRDSMLSTVSSEPVAECCAGKATHVFGLHANSENCPGAPSSSTAAQSETSSSFPAPHTGNEIAHELSATASHEVLRVASSELHELEASVKHATEGTQQQSDTARSNVAETAGPPSHHDTGAVVAPSRFFHESHIEIVRVPSVHRVLLSSAASGPALPAGLELLGKWEWVSTVDARLRDPREG